MQINKATAAVQTTNPFDREGVGLLDLPTWVGYTFGALFVVIGILCLFYIRRAKAKAQAYKDEQLVQYNLKHNKRETDYTRTGMYLPAWERAKMSLPIVLSVTFIFVGIAWMVGNTLSTL